MDGQAKVAAREGLAQEPKRKPGRPRKQVVEGGGCAVQTSEPAKHAAICGSAQETKRKPGRPRKQMPEGNSGMEQRAAKSKPRMQGCLDIDFAYWNAADIARRWDILEEQANGSQGKKRKSPWSADSETVALNGMVPGASQGSGEHPTPEELARAAFDRRRSVAISDEELQNLGLGSSCSEEAPEAAKLFWGDEELEDVGGGRLYPKRCIREEGDMLVAEWMQKEAEGTIPSGDYDVTAIVDERKRSGGKTQEFIVKWKGFELNPDQWLPFKMLWATKAMEEWTQKRAIDGQWHPSCHEEWARLSGVAAKLDAARKAHKGKPGRPKGKLSRPKKKQ